MGYTDSRRNYSPQWKEVAVVPPKPAILNYGSRRGLGVVRVQIVGYRYKRVNMDRELVVVVDGKREVFPDDLYLYDDTPENWERLREAARIDEQVHELVERSKGLRDASTHTRSESVFLQLVGKYGGSSAEHFDTWEEERRARGVKV